MKSHLLLLVGLALFASSNASAEKHRIVGENIYFELGKGVTFDSADKKYRLRLKPRGQLRYEFNEADSDFSQVFLLRRARLTATGHVLSKHMQFKLELALSPKDEGLSKTRGLTRPVALDFYVDFKFFRDASVRVGQYKLYYSRQRFMGSAALQLVDRSIAQAEFNLDRDLGAALYSSNFLGIDHLRYYLFAGVGDGRDQTDPSDLGSLYIARFEYAPFGHQKGDSTSIDFAHRASPSLLLAAAYAYNHKAPFEKGTHGARPADGGQTSSHNATADLLFKWNGLSILSEAYVRRASRERGELTDDEGNLIATATPRNGMGAFVEAGYLLKPIPVDFSARLSTIIPSETSSLSQRSEIGVGVGYYLAKHIVKIQGDLFRFFGEDFGEDVSHQARVQLELSF